MPEMPNGQVLSVKTFPSIKDAASIVPEEVYAQLPSTPSVVKVYETLLWLALHSPSGRLAFSQHALAAHLGCKQASISRAIGMLEQDGFIIIERGARGAANVYSLPNTRKKRSICAPESRITSRITLSHGVIPSDTKVVLGDTNPSSEGMALFTSRTFPKAEEAEGITYVSPANQGDTMPSTCGNAADNRENPNADIYNKIKESKENLLFPHAENEDPRFPYPDPEEARNLTRHEIVGLSKMIDDAAGTGRGTD